MSNLGGDRGRAGNRGQQQHVCVRLVWDGQVVVESLTQVKGLGKVLHFGRGETGMQLASLSYRLVAEKVRQQVVYRSHCATS
jgi:hypothetical protein